MPDATGPLGLISARYRLGELLGSGGSASVFAALDAETGESVALKILHPHLSRAADAREAFFREARAAESLLHPNIVRVLGVGVHDPEGEPQAWIALELARGVSLAEAVEQGGPLSVADALAVADGVLSALAYAHEAGLIHRDVSPANIMLARDPRGALRPSGVRLVDFGLADAAGRAAVGTDLLRIPSPAAGGAAGDSDSDPDPSSATAPGSAPDGARRAAPEGVLGNVNYLSPEQASGDGVDERGDLYQLGAVLYFALTGRPPFVRDSRRAVMLAHIQAPPPVPSVARPGLPRPLDRLIVKALLKDPAARFADAAEMQRAVRTASLHLSGSTDARLGSPDDPPLPGSPAPHHDGALEATAVLPGTPGASSGRPGGALPHSSPGSRGADDDRTALLPRSRSGAVRRTSASAALVVHSSSAAAGRPERGPASAVGPAGGRSSNSAPASSARGVTAGPGGAGAATGLGGRTPASSRGSLALWVIVALVGGIVVAAWTLAAGGVPPSTFAAGTATPEPVVTSAPPAPTPITAPSPSAVAATTATVPVLSSTALPAARDALTAAGLVPGAVTAENSASPADTVLRSSPGEGEALAPGSVVDLVVASGSNLVPPVAGTPEAQAQAALRAAGFVVATTLRESASGTGSGAPRPGTVVAVTPGEGSTLLIGSTVTLIVAVAPAAEPTPTPTPTPTGTPTPTPTITPDPSAEGRPHNGGIL